jgi:hypothetical protein
LSVPETKVQSIRFGICCAAGELEPWQARCLEHLAQLPYVTPVVSIGAQPITPIVSFRNLPNVPWAAVSTRTANAGAEAATVHPEAGDMSAEAVAQLAAIELDFILCFSDARLPDALIDVPRLGVWRYHVGDWSDYRGGPPAFWEVYDAAPATAVLLLRDGTDPAIALVLRQGFLRSQILSVRKNRTQLLNRAADWPARVCREIARTGLAEAPGIATLRTEGGPRRLPSPLQRARLSARILARMAAVGVRSLFRHDQWNIGIIDRPIEESLAMSVPDVRWLPATPRAELRADPFGTLHGGRSTIFCEYFSYRDNRGYIVAMDADAPDVSITVRIGPEKPVHLSYPYLLEEGGKLWCIPESSAAGEVAMYEFERFPDVCVRAATLIAGRGLADATLFAHQERWWLAASDVAEKGANSELHLWYADAPGGPWRPHAGNPVKIDVRSARPGGTPFVVDGQLYRPAQDCSSTYGARIVINRVLALSPTEFCEEVAATVNPDPRGPYPAGLHTLSKFGARTLIDGKRSIFVPAEFLRVLRHYLS